MNRNYAIFTAEVWKQAIESLRKNHNARNHRIASHCITEVIYFRTEYLKAIGILED